MNINYKRLYDNACGTADIIREAAAVRSSPKPADAMAQIGASGLSDED